MSISISPTLALNHLSRKLETEGRIVYKFGFGQSPFPVPKVFEEAIQKYAGEKDYLPSSGLPELKAAISQYYKSKHKATYNPDQIIIGPGSKMLLFLIRLCVDGHTILPSPSWVSYAPQAAAINKKTHWLETSLANSWLPDPDDLDDFCTKNQSQHLLIINYPSNPTGTVPDAQYLTQLSKVCRKHNVVVISDEIYKDLCFNEIYVSISKFYPEGTIICDGISKWAGAGGHRLGYALFPKELNDIKTMAIGLASETYSCVSNPIQRAAVELYKSNSEISDYRTSCIKILKHISKYTSDKLIENDIMVRPPEGGFYVFPSFENYKPQLQEKGIHSSKELCENMLQECGVSLLNGISFGRAPDQLEARFSYVDFDGKVALDNVGSLNHDNPEKWITQYAPKIKAGITLMTDWCKY